jgi:hypothetical protein
MKSRPALPSGDLRDLTPARGNLAFERSDDGGFKVAKSLLAYTRADCWSETSSMEANACTIPDINSIDIDDFVDWVFGTNLYPQPLEPFEPSEKSELIGGMGEWAQGFGCPDSPLCAWRLDAVSLDDLEDLDLEEFSATPLSRENINKTEWANPHNPFHNPQRNMRLASRSIADSGTESVPPLTEDYSRDSDSIAFSASVLNRDGPPSPRHVSAMHEDREPLSLQLDSVGATFNDEFQERCASPWLTENITRRKWANPHTPFHNLQWNRRLVCRSIADSGTESVPPLTEDYSRDSDSIAFSENVLNRDGPPSPRHVSAIHEGKAPLSPQLGSVGANFNCEFDQFAGTIESNFETHGHAVVSRKSPSLYGRFPSEGSSGAVDFDTLTIDSADFESYQSDTESIWMSDYSESVPVLENSHPFMSVKSKVVQDGLHAFQASQQKRPLGAPNRAGGTRSTSTATSRDSDKNTGKKRNRQNREGSDGAKGSGDDEAAPEKRRRASKKASGNQVSFACPFAKKDPLKYRSCYAYVLSRIRDVKQHLSRYHQLPIYCPRCMSTFETEDERDDHNRASSCVVQAAVRHEGVTRAQKAQLSARVSSTMTVEDQWFTIFDILFPGHNPRPRSPYINVELTVELEGFQDFMMAEGPHIILTAIEMARIRVSPSSNEERDLSALSYSAIQDGLQLIAQRWVASYFPDPSMSQLVVADGSSSSHASLAVEGSEPSRTSSDTLFDETHQTDPAAPQGSQTQNYALGQEDDSQVPPHGHAEAPGEWLNMISDPAQLDDQAQLAGLSSELPNNNQRDTEPTFDSDMGDGGGDWAINQDPFFELPRYEPTLVAAQLSEGYHTSFDEEEL